MTDIHTPLLAAPLPSTCPAATPALAADPTHDAPLPEHDVPRKKFKSDD